MEFLKKRFNLFILIFSLVACVGTRKSTSINSLSRKSKSSESIKKVEDYADYSVATIENCGQNISKNDKIFSLFPDGNGKIHSKNLSNLKFSGWNHTSNGNNMEWKNLKLESNNYNFNNAVKADSSCNNVATLNMILVKKIANWNHQHSNGFECNILAQGYKFGDIENLVFDLKINSDKTNIPILESIKKTYCNYTKESFVDVLDDGEVNIGITLGDNTNLNASIIFQLDQMTLSDQWIRVTIPVNKLLFYQEINYKRTPKTQVYFNNVVINRILIVGETKSGSVLRGNINTWNDNIPETFKEMDLSFKKIEFQLK